MLPHTCFRCGRNLADGERSFCSRRCQHLSFSELGTLERPLAWREYDYGSFDPEDELYGDYEIVSDGDVVATWQTFRWRPDGTEDWNDEPGESRMTASHPSGVEISRRDSEAVGRESVRLSQPEVTTPDDGHDYGENGICRECGKSIQAVAHFGFRCSSLVDDATITTEAADDSLVLSTLRIENTRLRDALSRIVERYERENGCREDPEDAVMLAWAMKSDAAGALASP